MYSGCNLFGFEELPPDSPFTYLWRQNRAYSMFGYEDWNAIGLAGEAGEAKIVRIPCLDLKLVVVEATAGGEAPPTSCVFHVWI